MHKALTGCTGVAAPALFNIVSSCLKPEVPFSAFAVLGSEVIFLQALNPAGYFPLEVLKIHEPGQRKVVGAHV
jgi:hypothetical protein